MRSNFSAGQLRWRYIFALSLIALLTISAQGIMQYLIADQSHDSRVINIAGRQRMLSQNITKTSFYIYQSSHREAAKRYRTDLRGLLDIWTRSHKGLLTGDTEVGLPGENSKEVLTLFEKIAPHYSEMVNATETILNPSTDRATLNHEIERLQANEAHFLKGMNQIVFLYDSEANQKVEFVRKLELVLVTVTLLVLVLEALFIFAPATRRIRDDMQRLSESEEDLKQLFAVSPTAMLLVNDSTLEITHANKKAAALIGYALEELTSSPLREHLDDEYEINRSFLEKIVSGESLNEYEVVLLDARRTVIESLVSVRQIRFHGQNVLVLGITNISELKKAQQTLEHYATYDEMTGLLNRRTGLMVLNKTISKVKRDKTTVTMFFIDLDGLKIINDQYGHAEGDWLIQTASKILSETIRSSDAAVRLGGDEFLLILHDCVNESCTQLEHRIESRLTQLAEEESKTYHVGATIGSATYDSERHTKPEDLITEADEQMYLRKRKKR